MFHYIFKSLRPLISRDRTHCQRCLHRWHCPSAASSSSPFHPLHSPPSPPPSDCCCCSDTTYVSSAATPTSASARAVVFGSSNTHIWYTWSRNLLWNSLLSCRRGGVWWCRLKRSIREGYEKTRDSLARNLPMSAMVTRMRGIPSSAYRMMAKRPSGVRGTMWP